MNAQQLADFNEKIDASEQFQDTRRTSTSDTGGKTSVEKVIISIDFYLHSPFFSQTTIEPASLSKQVAQSPRYNLTFLTYPQKRNLRCVKKRKMA